MPNLHGLAGNQDNYYYYAVVLHFTECYSLLESHHYDNYHYDNYHNFPSLLDYGCGNNHPMETISLSTYLPRGTYPPRSIRFDDHYLD